MALIEAFLIALMLLGREAIVAVRTGKAPVILWRGLVFRRQRIATSKTGGEAAVCDSSVFITLLDRRALIKHKAFALP